jgi:hypothetical protein
MRHYQSLMCYETGRCDGNHKTKEKLSARCTNLWICRQSAQNPLRARTFLVEKGYHPTVRIPREVLKCVAFIGEVAHQDEQGNVFGDLNATGFFVSVRSNHFPELRHVYFVTAKHVAEDIKDKPPYILVNAKNGEPTHITNFGPRWFFHPTDKSADVAILQIAEQFNVDHLAVLMDDFVTQKDIENREWVALLSYGTLHQQIRPAFTTTTRESTADAQQQTPRRRTPWGYNILSRLQLPMASMREQDPPRQGNGRNHRSLQREASGDLQHLESDSQYRRDIVMSKQKRLGDQDAHLEDHLMARQTICRVCGGFVGVGSGTVLEFGAVFDLC